MTENSHLGIEYFKDNQHYHKKEAERWVAELRKLGFGWLSLHQNSTIAIPEQFISLLLENDISPIIHFDLNQENIEPFREYDLLLRAYQSWGIQYISFFSSPNTHCFWKASTWSSNDVVEYFADIFISLAEIAANYGIHPILPPLVVAKEYWDTAFLRLFLESLLRRRTFWLFDRIILSAYTEIHDPSRPLDWGAGGPERWPSHKPFQQSANTQDHRGLYIFEWYNAIAQAILGKQLPIMLFEPPLSYSANIAPDALLERRLQVYRRFMSFQSKNSGKEENLSEGLSENILCFVYNKLSATSSDEKSPLDWFSADGFPAEIAEQAEEINRSFLHQIHNSTSQPIDHVLLLPMQDESALHQQLERLQPFLLQVQPLISFSIEEASQAKTVCIPEDCNSFYENEIKHLQDQGCRIQIISTSGTTFALRNLS